MMKKRYWYHCTNTNHGSILEVKKQFPRIKADKEPDTPRLTVAPSIAACFTARLFNQEKIYIYRTIKKCKAITPKNVWDQGITLEHWLIPPNILKLHDYVSKETVLRIQAQCYELYKYRKVNSDWKSRICQYNDAIKILKEMGYFIFKSEERFVVQAMKKFNIPEDYILRRINVST